MLKNQSRREFIKYGLGSLVGLVVGEESVRLFAKRNMCGQYATLQNESLVYQTTLDSISNNNSWNYEDLRRLEGVMQEMKDSLWSNPTLTGFCMDNQVRYDRLESEIEGINLKLEEIKPSIKTREITVVSETEERYVVRGTPTPIDLKTINLDERVRNVIREYVEVVDSKELKDYVERNAPQNSPKEFIMGFVEIFKLVLSGKIEM